MKSKQFPLPDSAIPPEFDVAQVYFVDALEIVASGSDPKTELQTVDASWKFIIDNGEELHSRQTTGLSLIAVATLCADPSGATAYASDAQPGFTGNFSYTSIKSPISIGDASYAFRGSGTSSDGSESEGFYLYWTHGPLVLSARMHGPAGSTSMDEVIAFAKQIEASYQAGQPTPAAPAAPIER